MTTDSTLPAQFQTVVRDRKFFSPGDTLVVGISGGADSTALLHLLTTLPVTPLRLIAAHLNHCLREAESDGDEEFCRTLSGRYAITFECLRVDVKALSKEYACSLEDAGRRARMAYFEDLSTKWQARAVVLAHHADDQAETFLMRLLRGSGLTGLTCMSHFNNRGYLRPLLEFTRDEIEQYLIEQGLPWRNDSSNGDRTFQRNRIRHELLPLLEQYNPAIRTSLITTAGLLSDENKLLDDLTDQKIAEICSATPRGITCIRSGLTAMPRALQRRVVRRMLFDTCGNLEHFGSTHVESVCLMAESERSNARLNLPRGVTVVREYDKLIICHDSPQQTPNFLFHISGPGRYQLPTVDALTIEECQLPTRFEANVNYVFLDLTKAPFPWYVRLPLPGDRLKPFGMAGSKKLKDLFIDNKIPLSQRRVTPLVFSGNELIWVCGLRSSRTAAVDNSTSRVAKVVFSRPE